MSAAESLDTVTHAAVRARQGDVAGARRMLRRILDRRPDDPAARALLRDLEGARHVAAAEAAADAEPAPTTATAKDLAGRFRSALGRSAASGDRGGRLRAILARIETMRQNRPDQDEGGRS